MLHISAGVELDSKELDFAWIVAGKRGLARLTVESTSSSTLTMQGKEPRRIEGKVCPLLNERRLLQASTYSMDDVQYAVARPSGRALTTKARNSVESFAADVTLVWAALETASAS